MEAWKCLLRVGNTSPWYFSRLKSYRWILFSYLEVQCGIATRWLRCFLRRGRVSGWARVVWILLFVFFVFRDHVCQWRITWVLDIMLLRLHISLGFSASRFFSLLCYWLSCFLYVALAVWKHEMFSWYCPLFLDFKHTIFFKINKWKLPSEVSKLQEW